MPSFCFLAEVGIRSGHVTGVQTCALPISNHIIESGNVNTDFVNKHTRFVKGQTDIGYGLRPEDPRQQAAAGAHDPGAATDIDFDQFAEFVRPYTLKRAVEETDRKSTRLNSS